MKNRWLANHTREHLAKVKRYYENSGGLTRTARSYRDIIAGYYNLLIPPSASVLEVGCGAGELLSRLRVAKRCGVDLSPRQIQLAKEKIPDGKFYVQAGEDLDLPGQTFDYIIVSETVNLAADVQRLFESLKLVSHENTRLIVNIYSSLWRPAIWLATGLGLRNRQPESNWLSKEDVAGLMHLTGWELVRQESRTLCPVKLLGIEPLLNRFAAPLLGPLCFSVFSIARLSATCAEKTVSVVVPARNEAGNIEAAIKRTPEMGVWTEFIFVEGNSKDNTWDEIRRVKEAYPHKRIKILQQTGKGKGNAVREGFAVAEGDLLMILDADLTMPPEELPKFYDALISGRCEFANGSRLVYPMDEKAMRFLNLCANKLFSVLFSWLLGQQVKDTLCGTKVLTKESYDGIVANRSYFGDFDPFGDFDLLFGASKLNLKILDIPIRYKERVYGETNIQRWKHGWLLLQMVVFAALKLKFI
ncbi:MAG: glycosyltransferase [Chthoniobacterales bacterium]